MIKKALISQCYSLLLSSESVVHGVIFNPTPEAPNLYYFESKHPLVPSLSRGSEHSLFPLTVCPLGA